MHIFVDPERCTGHGRCYVLAPDVFDTDDFGHSVVLISEVQLGTDLERQVHVAVANCPVRAITAVAD